MVNTEGSLADIAEVIENGKYAFFSGDSFVAGNVKRTLRGAGNSFADEVVRGLKGDEVAIVALPFCCDDTGIAHIISPLGELDDYEKALGVSSLKAETSGKHWVVETPKIPEYQAKVQLALDEINAGKMRKVVLGRGVTIESDPAIKPETLLARLLAKRPGRFVFSVPLGALEDDSAPRLIGASPELLMRKSGGEIVSFPLAGSVPRVADAELDAKNALALQKSTKDLAEHAFVVDDIVQQLQRVCADVRADKTPSLLSTDALHHLGTLVNARVENHSDFSALHLAQLLHPTPAVGGVPTQAATEFINRVDAGREFFTGTLGWVDAQGNGEFVVTIRAGVLAGNTLRLYAGAGIVAGSDPVLEARETGAKLSTMLKVTGI